MRLTLLFLFTFSVLSQAEDKPKWFQTDSKSGPGWDFYCTQSGKNDDESLTGARSLCAQKICMLFGVEVTAEVKSTETLKEVGVTNTVIEKCPNVRVVGRIEKNKTVNCEDGICTAYIRQFYPKAEYEKEYERLNRPAIVKEFEKTIIIREGNKTYKDPKDCRVALDSYAKVRGEVEAKQKLRITHLETALKACKGIDDRDVGLQSGLRALLSGTLVNRPGSYASHMAMALTKGGGLDDMVSRLKDTEVEKLETDKLEPSVKKLVASNFDWLFFRESYIAGQGFVLLSGKIEKENPLISEQTNCQKHFDTLLKWPKGFHSEVTVCVPNVAGGEVCNQVSHQLIRFSYFSCLCRIGSKAEAQCVQNMNQFVVDNCQGHTDKACFQKLGKFAAESMILNKIPSQLK